jgi:hypothetical protein
MQFPSQNVSFDESSISSSTYSSKLGANNNSCLSFFAFSILNPYFDFPPSTICFCCGFAFAFAAGGVFSFDDADFFFGARFLRAGAAFVLVVGVFFLGTSTSAGMPLRKGSSSEPLPSSLLDRADVPRAGGRLSLPLTLPLTGVSRLVCST